MAEHCTPRDSCSPPIKTIRIRSTVIPYSLSSAGRVHIGVYDLLGRRVQTLVDAVMPAGRHQVTFDAGKLSSGIYIYQLESGSTRITQKMILIK